MKKYLFEGEPPRWVIYISLVFLIILGAFCSKVWSAEIQYPVSITGSDIDSVWIYVWENYAKTDSLKMTSTPLIDTLVLDNNYDYVLDYHYWFVGETEAYNDERYIGWSTYQSQPAGSYDVTLYVSDTSGTDTLIASSKITVTNTATGDAYYLTANAGGYNKFNLDSGSYEIIARDGEHTFAYDTVTFTSDSVDTILGYDVIPGASASTNVCAVYGDIRNINGEVARYAEITFTLSGEAVDTCNNVYIGQYSVSTRTGSNGRFAQNLIYSSCLEDKKYNVVIKFKDGTTRRTTITVPSADFYQISN